MPLAANDLYPVHFALCAAAAATGALTFRLVTGDKLGARTLKYVFAGAALGAFFAPPIGDHFKVATLAGLLLIAFTVGMGAHAVIPLIPDLVRDGFRRIAAGWAAANKPLDRTP